MKLLLLLFLFVLVVSNIHTQTKSEISFSKDIFPLVKSKCLKCHEKDDDNPSNFAMDNLTLMKKTGKTKNMIVPGNGKESYLVLKLLPDPPKGAQMPIFSKKKLSIEEIELIARWIDEGAKNN